MEGVKLGQKIHSSISFELVGFCAPVAYQQGICILQSWLRLCFHESLLDVLPVLQSPGVCVLVIMCLIICLTANIGTF